MKKETLMSPVLVLTPEKTIVGNAVRSLKESRKIVQNFFYLTEGASSFYLYRSDDLKEMDASDECAFLVRHASLKINHSLAFVSLGCGNAAPDLPLLRRMHACKIPASYFGIDSSGAMLSLAEQNTGLMRMKPVLILGDFTLPDFKARFVPLVNGFDRTLYAMMGGTFGNTGQKDLCGALSRLLEPHDILYVDVVPLEKGKAFGRLKARYATLPENYERFFSQVLERMSIRKDFGHYEGEEAMETDPVAYRHTFFFRARTAFSVSVGGRSIPFKNGERMELLTIRAYDMCSLQAFFEANGFHFLGSFISRAGIPGHHRWQRMLLERCVS